MIETTRTWNEMPALLPIARRDPHHPSSARVWAFVARRARDASKGTVEAACRGVLTREDADEIAQEVVEILALGGMTRFRGGSARELDGFVRGVARRRALKRARGCHRTRVRETALAVGGPESEDPCPPSVPAAAVAPAAPPFLAEEDRDLLADWVRAGGRQGTVARWRGLSEPTMSRRLALLRGRLRALPGEDRERLAAWVLGMTGEEAEEPRAA